MIFSSCFITAHRCAQNSISVFFKLNWFHPPRFVLTLWFFICDFYFLSFIFYFRTTHNKLQTMSPSYSFRVRPSPAPLFHFLLSCRFTARTLFEYALSFALSPLTFKLFEQPATVRWTLHAVRYNTTYDIRITQYEIWPRLINLCVWGRTPDKAGQYCCPVDETKSWRTNLVWSTGFVEDTSRPKSLCPRCSLWPKQNLLILSKKICVNPWTLWLNFSMNYEQRTMNYELPTTN
jgi:hypothetical protein